MDVRRCRTRDDFLALVNTPEFTRRWMLERHLAAIHREATDFTFPGFCGVCNRAVDFRVRFDGAWESPDGLLIPNWRETLSCPYCWLAGRNRMMVGLVTAAILDAPRRDGLRVFLTEQTTPVYRWAIWTFPHVEWTGSEYLGLDVPAGEVREGLRHEDLEALSFASESFDLVVSCDVLEHVNKPERALAEIARVLRPGGTALLSFPMDPNLERNVRRARIVADGSIQHFAPAIYHGNPLSAEGSLVFTDFGWEVLEQMRRAGLADASLDVYWSYEEACLGVQFYFRATRR